MTLRKVKPQPFQWDNPEAVVPPPARTCGEDLPQDHLRHLLGGQPGPAQHLPDGGGAQLVRGQRRQPAVEGACQGDTEAARSAPGPGGRTRPAPAGASPPQPRRARRRPSPTAVLAADTKTTGSALMAAAALGAEQLEQSGAAAAAGAKAESAPVPPLARRRAGRENGARAADSSPGT